MNMANCEVFRLPADGMTGRTTAYLRLKFITAADRAAVPCGRWVKEKSSPYLEVVACQLIAGAMRTPEPHRSQAIGQYRSWLKPRYRYEVRR